MKTYEAPVIEVVEFAVEDVITESVGGTGADENYGGTGEDD